MWEDKQLDGYHYYTSPGADRYLLRGKVHESGMIELEEWEKYIGNANGSLALALP